MVSFCRMNYKYNLENFLRRLIPFYASYIKSVSSGIHNQSYWNYIRFRLTGKCNKMGGVFPDTFNLHY